VNHSAKEYVRGDAHTNTVEGFFSIFKRGVYGVYHHISEAHRYLAEFDFRYSNRSALGINDVERATRAYRGSNRETVAVSATSYRSEPVTPL
jgi:hypothetical protein